MSLDSLKVVLVEDNPDDVFLMERAVNKAGLPWKLLIFTDGQAAAAYFDSFKQNHFGETLPALIFLDLKLPYISGFELLASLRSQGPLKHLPVAILTSSPEQRDQQKALELGAKVYLVKPPTQQMLLGLNESLQLTAAPVNTATAL